MDASEWSEAEPRQDGDPEGGWPLYWWFGKLPLFWGSEVRSLGVHLDPALITETQVASVVHSAYFHLWPSCLPILKLGHSPLWSMRL